MTLRYEVVPGEGIVARYGDSIVWVGAPVAPEAWEALGAVLELGPGEDPAGAVQHQSGVAALEAVQPLPHHPAQRRIGP